MNFKNVSNSILVYKLPNYGLLYDEDKRGDLYIKLHIEKEAVSHKSIIQSSITEPFPLSFF